MGERTAIRQVAADEPAVYRIRVLGRLGDDWRDRFGGFELRIVDESPPTTKLTGLLADQAALMGVLSHLHASGVTLLEVERVDRPCGAAADSVGEDQSKRTPSAWEGSSRPTVPRPA